MHKIAAIVAASLTIGAFGHCSTYALAAEPTLAAVKKRGQLLCGVNDQLPGFSELNKDKTWVGLEVDFCRAVAAATLGDSGEVKFVPVTAGDRFDVLRAGEVDLLLRNSTVTLERTANLGVRDAATVYLDGQAVVVPKKLGIASLDQVAGKSICILNSTPYGRNLRDWFGDRKNDFMPVTFDTQDAMYEGFFAGKCAALTQDISALTTTIIASGKAADYVVLPEIVALEPLGAFVRSGDDQWFNVVRWTLNTLIDGEARGIDKNNVDVQRQSGSPAAKRLLGAPSDDGKLLGLEGDWAFNVLKQVGNYSEIYARNLGSETQWNFPRGVNALWDKGGIMFALPLR
jgi:general L-amino acid transport system substrate-binding protein